MIEDPCRKERGGGGEEGRKTMVGRSRHWAHTIYDTNQMQVTRAHRCGRRRPADAGDEGLQMQATRTRRCRRRRPADAGDEGLQMQSRKASAHRRRTVNKVALKFLRYHVPFWLYFGKIHIYMTRCEF